jgi:hypothetical protein
VKSTKPKIYISGPVTDMPGLNVQAFQSAAAALQQQGWITVNPHDNNLHADTSWRQHMGADIPLLLGCEAVYMLEGWQTSKGARLEHHIARELGMTILAQDQTLVSTPVRRGMTDHFPVMPSART